MENTLTIQAKDFNLGKTLGCGQHFRYRQLTENKYATIKRDNLFIVEQLGDSLRVTCDSSVNPQECLVTLGVYDDYTPALNLGQQNPKLAPMIEKSWGIKIMHQDPWEMLISFIISQRNSIKKIQNTIEKVCAASTEQRVMGTMRYYPFPTPKQLVTACESGKLDTAGLGYRLDYVESTAKLVCDQRFNIEALVYPKVNYETAMAYLTQLKGIGPKVANCVALFGLGHSDAFPIDTWVQAAINIYFGGQLDTTAFGKYAGFIQQCIFNYIRNET